MACRHRRLNGSSSDRHVDSPAIATALRDAFIRLAGIDQCIDEPDTDTNNYNEEDRQRDVVALPLAFGLLVGPRAVCVHITVPPRLYHLAAAFKKREHCNDVNP